MTNPHDIVIRPIVTEQSMADMADRKYTFVVQKGDTGMYDQMKSTMESLGIDEERLKNMSNEEVDQYVKEMCKKFGISQSLFDKLKDKFGR